jgi:hypothetical protein
MPAEVMTFKIAGEDGKETEVSIPNDAVFRAVEGAGFVREDKIAKDLDRRVKSIIEKKGLKDPKELMKDEEFLASVREAHGWIPKPDGSTVDPATGETVSRREMQEALNRQQKQLTDEAERKRQALLTQEVTPREEKLRAAAEREEILLAKDLQRQILLAAREAGVKVPFLTSKNGRPAPIVQLLADQFAYDDETREFYSSDADGNFLLSKNREGENTYETIMEYVLSWATDPANKDMIDTTGQGGPGVGGSRGRREGAEPGVVTISEEQAQDGNFMNGLLTKVGGDWGKIRIKRGGDQKFI